MDDRTPDRLLRVDLTAETVGSEPIPERWLRGFIGGKGLGARYLYEELDAGVDPLGPDNALLFVLGPVSSYLPGEGRYAAVTKSPLTGAFLDSYAGGTFPSRLAGALSGPRGDHLAVLVTGQAGEPVRLVVEDGDARIEPAETWGADAVETARAFPDASVACIGPAGENQVAYATIASDAAEHHAGRGGAGAVMGSKRLKAVVAVGEPPEPDDELRALRERDAERFADGDAGRWLAASGTVETVDFADEAGVLASRGWQDRGFDGASSVGIEAARDAAVGRERVVAEDDGDVVEDEGGPDASDEATADGIPGDFRVDTPDGESVPRGATAMSLGAGLAIDDFDAVAALGQRCNRLGLDLISAGNAVAWVMRAVESGLVDRDLAFGDPDAARTLLGEIAFRESELGDALADGVAAAAARLDRGASAETGGEGGDQSGREPTARDRFVPTVKHLSLPSYDPRGATGMALAYATSDRGGCHRRARPVEREVFDAPWSPERAARAVVAAQNERSVRWCLIADDFVGEAIDPAAWLDAVGAPHDDLAVVGERVWTLVRLFNVREGFDRDDDAIPAALRGSDELDSERFEAMLDAYYRARGWSDDGLPTRETLARLDLDGIPDDDTPLGPPRTEDGRSAAAAALSDGGDDDTDRS